MASTPSVSRVEMVQLVEALLHPKVLSPVEHEKLISFSHLEIGSDHFLLQTKDKLENSAKIFTGLTSAHEKSKIICDVNQLRIKIEKKQSEINTFNWLQIGRMLIVLNNDVAKSPASGGWCKWVDENITISKKRVDQAIKLAVIGPALEKYYFLGIDKLINFAMRLMAYGKTARFKEAAKLVGFNHTFEKLTPEEQEIVKKQIAEINKMDFFNSDLDMMLDRAERVGVKNLDKVLAFLRRIPKAENKVRYLTLVITNRGQGLNRSAILAEDQHKREHLISILSKFQESVKKSMKDGSSPYPPMGIDLVESSEVFMATLKELIKKNMDTIDECADKIILGHPI